MANEFVNSWNKVERIEKERIVDLSQKIGLDDAVKQVEESLKGTAQDFGSFVARMQNAIGAYNQANKTNILGGIDPVMGIERLSNFSQEFLAGYNLEPGVTKVEQLSDVFLPMDDPKAFIAKSLKAKNDLIDSILGSREGIINEAIGKRLEELSHLEFTGEEMSRASEFISEMMGHKKILEETVGKADTLDALKGLLDSDQIETLNMFGLRKLQEFGLFDKVSRGSKANPIIHLKPTQRLYSQTPSYF